MASANSGGDDRLPGCGLAAEEDQGEDSTSSSQSSEQEEEFERESGGQEKELTALFEQAASHLPNLVQAASKEQLLYLYARYKQAKVGKCNTSKPGFFDFEGKQKWEAWKGLGDMNPKQSMQEYITAVKNLDPSWNPVISQSEEKERRTGFGGPVISSLYQEETIREEDRNIFDYCRENNIDFIRNAIRSKNVDVNLRDEEGRTLLHWACDRGYRELVSVLLEHNADINSQDNEGQTALHYASACEFADVVELLLAFGADPTIQDQENCLPEEVTESKDISSLLHQYIASKS